MAVPVIVPDASVLLKWALESRTEEDRERALEIRRAWLLGECRIVVPSLWIYEVGNVLGSKEPRLARQLLEVLIRYRFEEQHPAAVHGKIFELMAAFKVSFYDAAYHATALKQRGLLVTADSQYIKRASAAGRVVALREWALH